MAKDYEAIAHPGRRGRVLAAIAFLGLFSVALMPRMLDALGGDVDLANAPLAEFLGRYASDAGLAAICSEPEILGEAHGLCGFGRGLRPSSGRVLAPARPQSSEIGFSDEPTPIGNYESPVLDHWEVGLSDLPGIVGGVLPTSSGGGGFLQIASSGGGGVVPFIDFDDSDGGGGGNTPPTEPPPPSENPVPEPTAGLLFGAGFLAIARRRATRS